MNKESKQQIWEKARANVDTLSDGLGLPVDEGIKDTVAILHCLHINTSASHEGKPGRVPHPYVVVEGFEYESIFQSYRALGENDPQADVLRGEMIVDNAKSVEVLRGLLNEFYKDRTVASSLKLELHPMGLFGAAKLEPHFVKQKGVKRGRGLILAQLIESQKEMNDFTDFLKQKFFN